MRERCGWEKELRRNRAKEEEPKSNDGVKNEEGDEIAKKERRSK